MRNTLGGRMRRMCLAALLLCAVGLAHAEGGVQETFLANYFGHTDYEVTRHFSENLDFVFACDSKEVCGINLLTRAIAFRVSGREIEPLLYVNNGTISNALEELCTLRIPGSPFAGWEFLIVGDGISAQFYGVEYSDEDGREQLDVPDSGPDFEWNQREQKFQERPVDMSQW